MKEYMSAWEMAKQSLVYRFWKTDKTQQLMKQSNNSANFQRPSHICYCFKLKARIFLGYLFICGLQSSCTIYIFLFIYLMILKQLKWRQMTPSLSQCTIFLGEISTSLWLVPLQNAVNLHTKLCSVTFPNQYSSWINICIYIIYAIYI